MSRLRRRSLLLYNRMRSRLRDYAEQPDSFVGGVSTGLDGFKDLPPALLHFASSPRDLYQVRAWIPVLERLSEPMVGVLLRHPDSYDRLSRETNLPLYYVRRFSHLADLVPGSKVKLLLYVNHSRDNYQPLRFNDVLHVHIGHGESDKVYMSSNQSKAYDRILVAGDAAVDRHMVNLLDFDGSKLVKVGRPQLDLLPPDQRTGDHVVYAPTYEGDIAGMRYTSVDTLGEAVVQEILGRTQFRLTYRPHPLTGVHDAAVREADSRIRRLVEAHPRNRAVVDTTTPILDVIADTDVMITDVSAVVLDCVAAGRPYFVTRPSSDRATMAPGPSALDAGYRLGQEDLGSIGSLVEAVLTNDPKSSERLRWARYHFGSYEPGSLIQQFQESLSNLFDMTDRLIEQRAQTIEGGGSHPRLDEDEESQIVP